MHLHGLQDAHKQVLKCPLNLCCNVPDIGFDFAAGGISKDVGVVVVMKLIMTHSGLLRASPYCISYTSDLLFTLVVWKLPNDLCGSVSATSVHSTIACLLGLLRSLQQWFSNLPLTSFCGGHFFLACPGTAILDHVTLVKFHTIQDGSIWECQATGDIPWHSCRCHGKRYGNHWHTARGTKSALRLAKYISWIT